MPNSGAKRLTFWMQFVNNETSNKSNNSKWFHPSDNRELLFYSQNKIYLSRKQPERFSTLGTAGNI
jgi:hypothetical protein